MLMAQTVEESEWYMYTFKKRTYLQGCFFEKMCVDDTNGANDRKT